MFEQQFLRFHRSELLDYGEENDRRFFSIEEARKRLAARGIHIDQFRSWAKVKELKTLADAVKHADGRSCEELKRVRPDLFSHPESQDSGDFVELKARYLEVVTIFEPLGGENIYVTDEAFDEYVLAVITFWNELAGALEES